MSKPTGDSSIPWLSLMTLLVAGGGLFWFVPSLVSSRPSGETVNSFSREVTVENIRLWEDPFGGRDEQPIPITSLAGEIQRRKTSVQDNAPHEENKALLIVPVIVSGKNYIEHVEERLRARYAVIQALAQDHFFPSENWQIARLSIPFPTSDQLNHGAAFGLPCDQSETFSTKSWIASWRSYRRHPAWGDFRGATFEWFERSFDKRAASPCCPRHVLVLWLPAELFPDRPLTRLAHLLSQLSPSLQEAPPVRLLGPSSSGELRAWVEEANEGTIPEPAREWLSNVIVLSSSAAATDDLLTSGLKNVPDVPRRVKSILEAGTKPKDPSFHTSFRFDRWNATDAEVVARLLEELRLRGIDPYPKGGPPSQIVIVSEVDTYYARALRTAFGDAVSINWRNVHAFSYLRGLDGMRPQDKPNEQQPGEKSGAAAPRPKMESPDGRAQTDYLRRLSKQLKALHREYGPEGGIQAVGVLGSDIYDKLEILAALRPVVPDAVFFTNQLDARLLHPDEWEKTRNIIVAASAPLEPMRLHPGSKKPDSPALRDSTQSAIYLAARRAVQPKVPYPLWDNAPLRTACLGFPSLQPYLTMLPSPPTWLYEIGRTGPVDLETQGSPLSWLFQKRPPTSPQPPVLSLLLFLLTLLVIGAIAVGSFRRSAQATPRPKRKASSWSLKDFVRPGIVVALSLVFPMFAFSVMAGFPTPRWVLIALSLLFLALLYGWVRLTHQIPRSRRCLDENERNKMRPLWLRKLFSKEGVVTLDTRRLEREHSEHPLILLISKHKPALVLITLSALVILSACMIRFPTERFAFDGTSHWPGLFLILVSGGLSIHFLFATQRVLKENERGIANDFGLLARYEPRHSVGPWETVDKLKKPCDIELLWAEYCARGWLAARLQRAGSYSLLYLLAMVCIGLLVRETPPADPFFRGVGPMLMLIIRFLAVSLGSLLIAFILDAVMLQLRFIAVLKKSTSDWPETTFLRRDLGMKSEIDKKERENRADYWDLLLVSNRTAALNRTMNYPFIVLAVFLLGFLPYFDTTPLPGPLIVVLAVECLVASILAARLPAAARHYRSEVLTRMGSRQRRRLHSSQDEEKFSEKLMEEIEQLHEGAFASIWEQPWLRAWLLPSGSMGLWTLLQNLPK